jgi:hypothetical protein
MSKEREEYLIVIPYLAAAAQGREIEYAIAGWRKHFKEPYRIVLTGEGLPRFPGEDIDYVESKRVDDIPGQYRQHLDYVSCFRKVRAKYPESEGFIFVADDCYAVNDFDIHDVKLLKMQEPVIDYDPRTPNTWRQDALKTARVLHEAGLPIRNFTTHLPQWIEWELLEYLWDKYDMTRQSYVFEDLYYNTFYPNRIPFRLNRDDNMKYSVKTTTPNEDELRSAMARKIWINNSPDGWTRVLEKALQEHFRL